MQAQLLKSVGPLTESSLPLQAETRPDPEPPARHLLIRVEACGVCHTELDIIEGRLPPRALPVIPGHQVVGRVAAAGSGCSRYRIGDRVGVAWLFATCGHCPACTSGRENLCPEFAATGKDADGGYANLMVAPEAAAYAVPKSLEPQRIAPLLCAGAIGYRALRLTGLKDGQPLGLCGFGSSAHLVLQLARYLLPGSSVHVFARSERSRSFALNLGADSAGTMEEPPPRPLQAIIDTTPAWRPVLSALSALQPGGRLVINVIRKEAGDRSVLQDLDYVRHLWMEKEVHSVANICREDVVGLLSLAEKIPLKPVVEVYPLAQANRALIDLKMGRGTGAKVLVCSTG